MKLLWLCNMVPGLVQEQLGGRGGGLWIDHVLSDLANMPGMRLHILCRGDRDCTGSVGEQVSYTVFTEPVPQEYLPSLEQQFLQELRAFAPDAIHIWGTEYGHTLAMMNAAEEAGVTQKTVISIQGLCSVYAGHFAEGVPEKVQKSMTLRDFLRKDNILRQREKYAQRGDLEVRALEKAAHVMGRTDWDRACTDQIQPKAQYHHCCETLREPFYQGQWQYDNCRKHRIFASSCVYPVKGFHYLLEAFAQVVKRWPDATLTVPGQSFLADDFRGQLRQQSYHKYLSQLVRKYGLEDKITFLGGLSGEDMKRAYLDANVFALPSTIENSPNSLGEAMLLGVPCVAADVGGVTSMMEHGKEGYVYQSTAAYMLAYYIERVFEMEDRAAELGMAAQAHARATHDPAKNLKDLLDTYTELAGK